MTCYWTGAPSLRLPGSDSAPGLCQANRAAGLRGGSDCHRVLVKPDVAFIHPCRWLDGHAQTMHSQQTQNLAGNDIATIAQRLSAAVRATAILLLLQGVQWPQLMAGVLFYYLDHYHLTYAMGCMQCQT